MELCVALYACSMLGHSLSRKKYRKGKAVIEDKNETEILSTECQLEGGYFENREWESDSWDDL